MLSFDARRVQGALFDLDGTLVDSLPDLHFAVCEVLKSWGLEPMEEEEVGRYIGKGAIHLAAEVLRARKPDATAEERDRFVKEYVNTLAGMGCSHTRAIPGVLEALGIFRSEGLKLALVTNKAGVLIDAVLEQAGLSPYFPTDLRLSADDMPTPKPAPDMLLLAASRMGLDPADCMMLGDSRNDAQAAANAGMPVMLMETGYNEGEPIAKWGPQNGFCDIFKSMDLAAKSFSSSRH